jgi:hypothetical protein
MEEPSDRPSGLGDHLRVRREVVHAARKQHELTAGNNRRQQTPLVSAYSQILAAVENQDRDSELPEHLASVTPSMT